MNAALFEMIAMHPRTSVLILAVVIAVAFLGVVAVMSWLFSGLDDEDADYAGESDYSADADAEEGER